MKKQLLKLLNETTDLLSECKFIHMNTEKFTHTNLPAWALVGLL